MLKLNSQFKSKMVKLPVFDLGIGRRRRHEIPRPPRNHHQWGTSKVPYLYGEPKGLQDLEILAQRTVALMEKHGPKSEHNYHKAMNLLRLQYNMVSCYLFIT